MKSFSWVMMMMILKFIYLYKFSQTCCIVNKILNNSWWSYFLSAVVWLNTNWKTNKLLPRTRSSCRFTNCINSSIHCCFVQSFFVTRKLIVLDSLPQTVVESNSGNLVNLNAKSCLRILSCSKWQITLSKHWPECVNLYAVCAKLLDIIS